MRGPSLALVQEVWLQVLGLLTLGLYLPVALLLLLPGALLRQVMVWAQPRLRPDLGGVLSRLGSVWATAGTDKTVILCQIGFKGQDQKPRALY